ncbi:hypothetical protein CC85DRAFT_305950 [Cutaneotrichosporon oleaginosum]|uniref:SURP motif domain-containing protein n=1 Tax=Cutaneotrichosporon oleaginosum TaxID=879819 RepID=A0A0J0XBL9_9TREE|nr:uncharacterized protein CC85DRAFT_305950 [Cutaneotrichosporon oleaginosum]KLT38461.1 hypothetical protein CC85DRAFT_305950 [Cutaneotrichosporon oleaginosum]TXT05429.1 hypothetical protein COLE_06749 [Cutaneotrichosporon oleaginosum]
MHKRRRRAHAGQYAPELEAPYKPPAAAYVRAYEAQLVDEARNPGLIPWAGDESVLADRHNILHLLPDVDVPSPPSPGSISSSWTIPSDAEEAFELSGDEEVAAHARARKQKWVDALREARLAEREREDEEAALAEEKERDEEPPPDIANLMAHTARSLAASPNPAILISKIMARHAADARFTFLRPEGVWAGAWARAQLAAGITLPPPPPPARSTARALPALGGLGGYDSASDSDDGARHAPPLDPPPPPDSPPPPPPATPPPPR